MLWVLGPMLLVPACSALSMRAVTEVPETTEPTPVAEPVETFDPSPYREERPPTRTAVSHDVPESLMRGRAADRLPLVSGYRIQLLSTRDKADADQATAQAIQWWNEARSQEGLESVCAASSGVTPVYLDFVQPYWRVRFGDFVARDGAQEVLKVVRKRFASAFLAPAKVACRAN